MSTHQKDVQEKPSTHNEKAQKIVLLFGAILVAALIVSMFVGGGSKAPKPLALHESQRDNQETTMSNGFLDQVNFEKSQQQFKALAQERNISIREPTKNTSSPQLLSWEKKEFERTLNSRTAGFAFTSKERNSNKALLSRQDSVGSSKYSQLPLTPLQIARLKQHFAEGQTEVVGRSIHQEDVRTEKSKGMLIPTGLIISGALDQDIISDYRGPWRGMVNQDVYSVDNEFILIPKGSQVVGQSLHISNVNEPIQNRLGLTVQWVVLPDGKRIDFRKQAALDRSGIAAVGDEINRHLGWQFGGVAAYALLSASLPRDGFNQYGNVNPTFKGQLGDGIRGQLAPMINKYLSLVPTATLNAGTPIKIFIQDDLYTKPWARVN